MKLFDKYLLACTNQRIPMPGSWQSSLGLQLSNTTQYAKDKDEAPMPLTGYRFQQEDVLTRGYVHRQVQSMQLDQESTYLLLLYLQAQKEHNDLDVLQYFTIGETAYKFPYYTTIADIIPELPYSIYGKTTNPITVKLYNEAEQVLDIATISPGSLDINTPIVINPSTYLQNYLDEKAPRVYAPIHSYPAEGTPEYYYFTIDGIPYIMRGGAITIDRTLNTFYVGQITLVSYNSDAGYRDILADYIPEQASASVTATLAASVVKGFSLVDKSYTIEYDEVDATKPVSVSRSMTIADLQARDEYYRLQVISESPVAIVPGSYPRTPISAMLDKQQLTAKVIQADSPYGSFPVLLPRAGYEQLQYSNKLIPALLDMNITEKSPTQEQALLPPELIGGTTPEKIMLNTNGIYDVDDNLGDKLIW